MNVVDASFAVDHEPDEVLLVDDTSGIRPYVNEHNVALGLRLQQRREDVAKVGLLYLID